MKRNMFGNSPERERYINDGYSLSFMNRMEEILRPFRAYLSWLCHFIPLHGMLMYETLSGLCGDSPERALYFNDGCSPSDRELSAITSPEGAEYANDGYSPSKSITSPERALYTSEVVTLLAINKTTN